MTPTFETWARSSGAYLFERHDEQRWFHDAFRTGDDSISPSIWTSENGSPEQQLREYWAKIFTPGADGRLPYGELGLDYKPTYASALVRLDGIDYLRTGSDFRVGLELQPDAVKRYLAGSTLSPDQWSRYDPKYGWLMPAGMVGEVARLQGNYFSPGAGASGIGEVFKAFSSTIGLAMGVSSLVNWLGNFGFPSFYSELTGGPAIQTTAPHELAHASVDFSSVATPAPASIIETPLADVPSPPTTIEFSAPEIPATPAVFELPPVEVVATALPPVEPIAAAIAPTTFPAVAILAPAAAAVTQVYDDGSTTTSDDQGNVTATPATDIPNASINLPSIAEQATRAATDAVAKVGSSISKGLQELGRAAAAIGAIAGVTGSLGGGSSSAGLIGAGARPVLAGTLGESGGTGTTAAIGSEGTVLAIVVLVAVFAFSQG